MSRLKGLALIVLAALLAVVAGGLSYVYLKAAPATPAEIQTVPLVVATKDITFGTKLGAEDLRLVDYPAGTLPAGAYTLTDSVLGQTTKVFLVEGEPILASKLSSVGGGLSVRIPESMRASSVDVNEVSGVSGFVLPGDRVDVLVTIDNVGKPGNSVTKMILQDVEVLAAGVKTETKNTKPVDVQAVTLLVDPRGGEDLALALHQGEIHLLLRNPTDRQVSDVAARSTHEVIGTAASARAAQDRPVRQSAPRPPKPKEEGLAAKAEDPDRKPPSFTIIRNGKIEEQKSPTDKGKGGSGR
jgi:pilus assembly protein CpaB